MSDSDLLNTLRELELELHRSDLWQAPDRVETLLHREFEEIGRSGRTYSRAEVIDALTKRDTDRPEIASDEFRLQVINDCAALLTYISSETGTFGERCHVARRASRWLRTPDGWQLRFHQGTPTNDPL